MSSTTKACFNSNCKEASEKWRTGWRRRTGEYAHLCDRCAAVYEDGKFCETFHLNAPGWRCCESCGKQIHCGCIVSFHMFVLLDAGGIECLACARKSYILTPNPAWPPPLHFLPSQPERMKDLSVKPWSSIAGSGPVPWRQAPSLFNGSVIQSNVPLRMPFEMNVSGCVRDRISTASPQMKAEHSYERLISGNLSLGLSETLHQNGNTGLHVKEQPYHPLVNGMKPLFPMIDSSPSTLNFVKSSSSNIEAEDAHRASIISEPVAISILMGKHRCCPGGTGSCGEPQICSGKARADGRSRKPLLPRYHPQISEETLQLISGEYPIF
ncbi:B3 domain-containing protein os07g0563300 [Phtheirospermum japonicum]|uniref:B3 domain-containing protein os07g0563300 n=1 Tax=Phtheirospermum japonicum TaxID=374723 RepID=A0A830CUE0_9LAMI|nr:B3 domain-containing protein os07g0563300 [Phtheirospermum japonicum]